LQLLELLNKVGRDSFPDSQGQEAVNVDGRFCLAVPADSCNQVSGLLLRSSSGVTAYVEPAVAVPLNNKLAEARADVLAAEYSVLLKLTDQLRPFLDDIQSALNIIVDIDVVMARARYSTWMGSTKPTFIDDDGNHPVALQLLRARHPLLVQQHRQLLKEAKTKLKSKTRMLGRLRARAGITMAALEEMQASFSEAEALVLFFNSCGTFACYQLD
jgi:dsDNA-specific endonuclease/ATPase MutS2